MEQINAEHYTDMLIYAVDKTVTKIKLSLGQYIASLDIGITAEQFAVLDTIYRGENLCQLDVAKILMKDKSNIKRIAEILEHKGLINRILSKRENRALNYLKITDSGKTLIDENVDKVKSYLTEIFRDITDEEVQVLKNIMQKVNGRLSKTD